LPGKKISRSGSLKNSFRIPGKNWKKIKKES